jgi:hypothetical protein
LATVVAELLKQRDAGQSLIKREDLDEFVTPVKRPKKDKEEENEAPVKMSPSSSLPALPPSSPSTPLESVASCISLLQERQSLLPLDHHYDFIGVPAGGGAAAAGGGGLLAEMMQVMTHFASSRDNVERWMWNNMPENVGMALIRPEVVAVIETAHEDIKRLSSAHARIKLWHLMTSPSVSHHFAMMISGMLNACPGEIQYPHYTRNVRDNGAVTGARVSSGFWVQARSAQLYKVPALFIQIFSHWLTHLSRKSCGSSRA